MRKHAKRSRWHRLAILRLHCPFSGKLILQYKLFRQCPIVSRSGDQSRNSNVGLPSVCRIAVKSRYIFVHGSDMIVRIHRLGQRVNAQLPRREIPESADRRFLLKKRPTGSHETFPPHAPAYNRSSPRSDVHCLSNQISCLPSRLHYGCQVDFVGNLPRANQRRSSQYRLHANLLVDLVSKNETHRRPFCRYLRVRWHVSPASRVLAPSFHRHRG